MIYLSGVVKPEIIGMRPDLGLILTPDMGNAPDLSATPWAGDNGCFNAGERFSLDRFFAFLTHQRGYANTCLFAVAPDVVGNAAATWDRSRPILPLLRAAGYRAALAAQDGMYNMSVDWSAFDALFIGGSTAWKLSHHARDAAAEAKARGKWVHMGG